MVRTARPGDLRIGSVRVNRGWAHARAPGTNPSPSARPGDHRRSGSLAWLYSRRSAEPCASASSILKVSPAEGDRRRLGVATRPPRGVSQAEGQHGYRRATPKGPCPDPPCGVPSRRCPRAAAPTRGQGVRKAGRLSRAGDGRGAGEADAAPDAPSPSCPGCGFPARGPH